MHSSDDERSVLIIDDDRGMLKTLSDILDLRGYRPHTAATGNEALRLADGLAIPPAIALVDLRLPDMDGLELVSRLRALSELTEVVVLTGNASLDTALRALREHSFDYLIKPVRPDQLLTTLEKASARFARNVAESALRRSEERLRRMFQAVNDAVFITDAMGRVIDANEAAQQLTGRTDAELREQTIATFLTRASESQAVALPASGFALEAGEYWLRMQDDTKRLIDLRAATFEPGQYVCTVRDLTEQRQLEEELRFSQKMEAVGRLAGGVAHDFNNILTAIRGYSDLVLDQLAPDTEMHADVYEISRAAERAAGLTRQLLAFSRKQLKAPAALNPNEVITELEAMLKRIIRPDIRLEMQLAPDVGRIFADRGQIEQILLNLVINASDAMPSGGTVTIRTMNDPKDDDDFVLISVADTGVGIPRDVLPHIFDPFFTTKEVGKGTGLGLATVWGIAREYNGHVFVQTEPGLGSTFTVQLPVSHHAEEAPAQPHALEAVQHRTLVILLVEDDFAIRRLMVKGLTRKGYEVVEAENGAAALEIAKEIPRIDLLITDLIMPVMNGSELARRIAEQNPGIRTVFISGYSEEAAETEGLLQPSDVLLEKPFAPDDLARLVAGMFETGGG